jgi:pyruvate ferredoxin oxidoreductase gamma subunit
MYRIRVHGRGGHGIKTAGRILGTAFFAQGFEVQDAPRYGAERRGAPIFATVRASRSAIHERGVIRHPDLVVVADDTLVPVAAAAVLGGLDSHTVLLIESRTSAPVWRERLRLAGPVLTLPLGSEDPAELRFLGATCAGAAARLLGILAWETLARAIREELAPLGEAVVTDNLERARHAYARFDAEAGCVQEGEELEQAAEAGPDWIDLPLDPARVAAPDVHARATSVQVRTGLWRTMRPVIDHEHCHRCTWICTTLCPDGAIHTDDEGRPEIDYDHCKGCLVCVAVCPPHAIGAIPEREAAAPGDGEQSA